MGKLIISRRNEWNIRARRFIILIDGEKHDVIGNGEVKEFLVSPGKHTVLFKVDWCSSPEVEIEVNDEKSKTIEVSGFKLMRWIYPILYSMFGLFLILKWVFEIYARELVYAVVPLALILMYYLTLGRKKYIEIKEL